MRPKKHLGQHFLTVPYYARRIAESIGATAQDTVVEIGPGRGALSVHLVKRFPHMHLVEYDRDVVDVLRDKLGPGTWTLHQADAVRFDYASLPQPLHAAGNLPYSVAAEIIHTLLRRGTDTASCTFMVQREVAERIAAAPGSKRFGYLSVFCQYFGAPRVLFHVPRGAFFPKPEVESSVFQLVVNAASVSRLPREDWPGFFGLVDKAFQKRRKTVLNALSDAESKDRWRSQIADSGFDAGLRPEDVGVDSWVALFRNARRS